MRVLVTTQSASIVGGVESYLSELLPRLAEIGFEVGLATEESAKGSTGLRAPADNLNWQMRDSIDAMAVIEAFKPAVVFQNGLSDPHIEAALLSRAPAVLFAHGYYGTCVSGTKHFSSPVVQTCHRRFGAACLALYMPRRCGGLNPATAVRLFTLQRERFRMLGHYRHVLVASEAMRAEYLRHGVAAVRLSVVPLFVAVDETTVRSPRPRRGPIVMFSRLGREKGQRELIEAVAVAQSKLGWALELTFAGRGSFASLERLAKRRGVMARFLGWVTKEERSKLMAGASLLAVPSVFPEPFGLVGIEAGAQGLPAVGFAAGGIVDWLIDGKSGMSAPGERPRADELAVAIVRALEDEGRYQTLCHGARQSASGFSVDRHIRSLSAALEEAAGGLK
jgi:glycosyltransferase involved in cell wall biosynthesis